MVAPVNPNVILALAEIRGRLSQLESALGAQNPDQAEEIVRRLAQAVHQLRQDVDQMQNQIAQLRTRVTQLQGQQAQIDQLTATTQAQQAQIDALNAWALTVTPPGP